MFQGVVDTVGYCLRFGQSATFRQEYFHGKLFAVGVWHGAEFQLGEDEEGCRHDGHPTADSEPWVAECPVEGMVVSVLHPAGDASGMTGFSGFSGFFGLYQRKFHDRYDDDSQQERDHQIDGDGEWQSVDKLPVLSFEDKQEGIEDGTDTECGQQHWEEIVLRTLGSGMPSAVAFPEIFQIAVEHHDRVVNNHAEHDDKACQRHRVQGDSQHVHDAHADECGERDGDSGHDSRSEGEENHHDKDDDEHRFDEVQQEILHRIAHHFGLVGYAGDADILWQHVLAEIIEQAVDGVTVFHDVVAFTHLQGYDDAGMAVLLDVALRAVVFTADGGYIAHSYHMVLGIGIYNKVTYFLLGVDRAAYVDGHVLLLIRQRSGGKNQAVGIEFLIELHRADAVG